MIISKKKYEKLNNDLVDAKAKVDDAKKELDDENKIMRATLLIKEQRDQLKTERNSLIDDLSWYKAKVSRLERELKKKNMDADRLGYRWRNSHDEAKTYKSLLSEFSQHIGNKPSSSTYKYFRAKLDGIGIKEGE
ncbi:hypothetical protein QI282_11665 [Staphylococcus saprophyticus]|uniref:hypothetical protein n=1 Tax=Staphylococcus saprophyticus TaxID=29385 RepID=UPI00076B3A4C|nr:hypothetical protein [Staphylococcus saprophyticus]AMG20058.1 hypothetical protein AL528_07615 [Staphylococcus saprophyticus]MDW3828441.1 hypothetical protein [Staphylococcus saprophyticus]MDW4016084.1 hypothetical protein [Staphylococcus saprophyticus]MDW4048388.1 hypothetical protein [Staphylococcus saprophyticus]MDW4157435.1 hypothetical protein [Staphylococcus saprophyticus]